MKILLLGKNGQIGWELQRALAPLGEIIALDRRGAAGFCGDLENLDGLAETVRYVQPDVIVNAAAYTAVDKAESEPDLAELINVKAPAVLAREAQVLGSWLIHYSTDYVFDGSGDQPWREIDFPRPLSVYGRTKLAGEQAIQQSGAKALILRTSWVYAARGGNFAKTMLRLARERDQLRIVDDQSGAPTGAELVADITAHALARINTVHNADPLAGVYHLAAAGETTWCRYARFVLEQAARLGVELKAGPDEVTAIATEDSSTPAPRPRNSRLDTTKLQTTFGLQLPDWQAGVVRMLAEITG